jgi:hypothetical protein
MATTARSGTASSFASGEPNVPTVSACSALRSRKGHRSWLSRLAARTALVAQQLLPLGLKTRPYLTLRRNHRKLPSQPKRRHHRVQRRLQVDGGCYTGRPRQPPSFLHPSVVQLCVRDIVPSHVERALARKRSWWNPWTRQTLSSRTPT